MVKAQCDQLGGVKEELHEEDSHIIQRRNKLISVKSVIELGECNTLPPCVLLVKINLLHLK